MQRRGFSTLGSCLLAALCALPLVQAAQPQDAPVKVEGAWVRSTVPGQQGTGAFMTVTAARPMKLVGVATPVAGAAEVHEMKMQDDVMIMRPVRALDLPAGQPVQLKPGGYHIMLQDLKQPLPKESVVALTLFFSDAQGVRSRLELKLPVALQAPAAPAPAAADAKR